MRILNDTDELTALLKGVVLLGTGGGGDPRRGSEQIAFDLARERHYSIVSPSEVEDTACIVSGGFLGHMELRDSWKTTLEDWETFYELEIAVREMERLLGRRVDYMVPFEMGGGNTVAVLSCAARLGIPVIDGDGLGRAAPETQMTSFVGHGISPTPMIFVDGDGGRVTVVDSNLFFPDEVGRFITTQKGRFIANCHYPMTGKQMKDSVIPGTISRAIHIGSWIMSAVGRATSLVKVLADQLGGAVLTEGTVASVSEKTEGGFFWGEAVLQGDQEYEGRDVRLVLKNEVMMAEFNSQPIAVFPDHLYLVQPDTGEGVLTRYLKKGAKVGLIGEACHPRLRKAALSEIGKAAFSSLRYHMDVPYRPIEELLAENISEGVSG